MRYISWIRMKLMADLMPLEELPSPLRGFTGIKVRRLFTPYIKL